MSWIIERQPCIYRILSLLGFGSLPHVRLPCSSTSSIVFVVHFGTVQLRPPFACYHLLVSLRALAQTRPICLVQNFISASRQHKSGRATVPSAVTAMASAVDSSPTRVRAAEARAQGKLCLGQGAICCNPGPGLRLCECLPLAGSPLPRPTRSDKRRSGLGSTPADLERNLTPDGQYNTRMQSSPSRSTPPASHPYAAPISSSIYPDDLQDYLTSPLDADTPRLKRSRNLADLAAEVDNSSVSDEVIQLDGPEETGEGYNSDTVFSSYYEDESPIVVAKTAPTSASALSLPQALVAEVSTREAPSLYSIPPSEAERVEDVIGDELSPNTLYHAAPTPALAPPLPSVPSDYMSTRPLLTPTLQSSTSFFGPDAHRSGLKLGSPSLSVASEAEGSSITAVNSRRGSRDSLSRIRAVKGVNDEETQNDGDSEEYDNSTMRSRAVRGEGSSSSESGSKKRSSGLRMSLDLALRQARNDSVVSNASTTRSSYSLQGAIEGK